MPPNPGDWLPEDHLARFVLELVWPDASSA
jgi:hypothetical protein